MSRICTELEVGDWPIFGDTPPATWGPTLLHFREVHDDRDPRQVRVREILTRAATEPTEPTYPAPWARDPAAPCGGLEQNQWR